MQKKKERGRQALQWEPFFMHAKVLTEKLSGEKGNVAKPWRPEHGQVFTKPIAFDCETTLIDTERDWVVPAFVLGAAFDGNQGYFVRRDHVAAFFAVHRDVTLVMHNAPFDLAVINTLVPSLDIYSWVDRDKVWDTELLHRLNLLGTEGHTARGKGESTLEHCADTYLGIELPKDQVDSQGSPVRLSYGQWLGRPPANTENIYLDYLAKDVIATYEVISDERSKAKPINFGKPGGMGDTTMRQYAKVSYGMSLSEQEVKRLSDAWFELFPEMKEYLTDNVDSRKELAKLLKLTPNSHFAFTYSPKFLRHLESDEDEFTPSPILGGMTLRAIKVSSPETARGEPYSQSDLDYFWSKLAAKKSLLSVQGQAAVAKREPSPRLQREVMSLVGRAGVFTATGRLRANATYSARHNTVFQGLAADGAKLALWRLFRAGYRIVNFVHDEMVVEVPATSNLKRHAERIRELMIEGMKEVVPDIVVDVSYAAAERWYKGAKAVFDNKKRLLPWRPEDANHEVKAVVA